MDINKFKSLNEQLKKIIDDFMKEYERAKENSWSAYVRDLPVNGTVPGRDTIIRAEDRTAFTETCARYYETGENIILKARDIVLEELTKAPTEEAVRTVEMLKLRDNISEAELAALMDKYGDNPQTYNAIRSIALKQKIYIFEENEHEDRLKKIDIVRENLQRFFVPNGSKTAGVIYIINTLIDEAFPIA